MSDSLFHSSNLKKTNIFFFWVYLRDVFRLGSTFASCFSAKPILAKYVQPRTFNYIIQTNNKIDFFRSILLSALTPAVQFIHKPLIHRFTVCLFSLSLCGQKYVKLRASWHNGSRHSRPLTAAEKTRLPSNGQRLYLKGWLMIPDASRFKFAAFSGQNGVVWMTGHWSWLWVQLDGLAEVNKAWSVAALDLLVALLSLELAGWPGWGTDLAGERYWWFGNWRDWGALL